LNLRESPMMRERALGVYEYRKRMLFERLVKPGMTVLDIGANKGYFSFISCKLMKGEGRVLSFEPDFENCGWIEKSIAANNYKNIKLFPIALFDKNARLTLFRGQKSGHHSLVENKGLGSTIIEARRLDNVLFQESIEKTDLIKIDVEGAEIQVLQGAENTLKNQSPKLIIDLHNIDKGKLFDLLDSAGYKVFDYLSGSFVKLDKQAFVNNPFREIYAQK